MLSKYSFLLCLLLGLSVAVFAQKRKYGMLTINLPGANWSEQTQAGQQQFSNYNTVETEKISITLTQPQSFTGKPEPQFATLWRQFMQLADTATAPRFRKVYTNDSQLMLTGGALTNGPDGQGYYQLTVYLLGQKLQALLLRVDDAKIWKTKQYDWMEWLQNAIVKE
ncbi:MAG TPA: hypothetical protein PKD90_05130 [Phnomibacter sp.]|nr:hypothetical protein [Phnomibacter sp.]